MITQVLHKEEDKCLHPVLEFIGDDGPFGKELMTYVCRDCNFYTWVKQSNFHPPLTEEEIESIYDPLDGN